MPSLDRLSRSLQDLITLVGELSRRAVGFRSLHEALDTTTPGGRLVFHVFAALAEFIREIIVEATNEGLKAARARGRRLGRPPALNAEQIRQATTLLAEPTNTVASIARLLGVSPLHPLRPRPRTRRQEPDCGLPFLTGRAGGLTAHPPRPARSGSGTGWLPPARSPP